RSTRPLSYLTESLPVRGAPPRRTNLERSWRKTAPRPRRRDRTKGKSYSLLASPCHFSVEMLDFMTHLLFFYRELCLLENLTYFDCVAGFGRATLRPFHDFFL